MDGKATRIAIGIAFWVLFAAGLWRATSGSSAPATRRWSQEIVQYAATPMQSIALSGLDGSQMKRSDPVFYRDRQGEWQQVGHVISPSEPSIAWYAQGIDPNEQQLVYHQGQRNLGEVFRTLLPKHRRDEIEQLVRQAVRAHGSELTDAFKPLVERSLRESVPVIRDAFKDAVRAHRPEIDSIAERYRQEVLKEKLLPMLRSEVLPIVREHGEPVAEKIGRELWDRASIWRFGWRFVYDKSPLPERELVKDEWDRFVREEAIPVFESHEDEVVDALRAMFAQMSDDPEIREQLKDVAEQVANDKELRQLIMTLLKESIIENKKLREVWSNVWKSPEAEQAYDLASDRIEPVIREIGDRLFGTRDDGITPEFARVLRSMILNKDRRWLVVVPRDRSFAPGPTMPVVLAGQAEPFPLVVGLAADGGDDS
jgi:hypothetical protein